MSRLQRAAPAIATLAVLIAIACGGASRHEDGRAGGADCDATPRNHMIEVGEEVVSCKEPHVSKSAGNQITWRSVSGGNIEIHFKPKAGVVPFPGLTCPGNSPVCNSGAIDAAASGRYDYDIWLYTGSDRKSIDPGVIIDP